MLIGWPIFGSFLNETHPFVFVTDLGGRVIHVSACKLDPEHAYMDSNGNRDLSINECDAYLQSVSILFRLNNDDHRTMDFDTDQLMN